jgi:hypothetical protein
MMMRWHKLFIITFFLLFHPIKVKWKRVSANSVRFAVSEGEGMQ